MLKVPLRHTEIFNTAKTTNDDFLATAAVPGGSSGPESCAYRVTVAFTGTNSVLNLRIASGATTVVAALNNNTALTADVLYTFTFGASDTYTYNFRVGTNTTVSYFLLEEIQTGVV